MKLDLSKIHYPKYDSKTPSIAILNNGEENKLDNFEIYLEDIIGIRAHGSSKVIKLPTCLNKKLAYLTGVILGDGSIAKPIKRKKGGFYWSVRITGEYEYIKIVSKILFKIFNYIPLIYPDKRRENSWYIALNSLIIHRFFNRVIGIKFGAKNGKTSWLENFCRNKDVFGCFLAGFTDSDGYVSKNYIGIIQKDKKFLEKLKMKSYELLNINFNGPYVNRKICNEIVGWIITINNKNKMKEFLETVPMRYKNRNIIY
ncbi:MAG: LAGLIDADG family homing endonuclease [Nanoarchaeota archaeon]|nr:LAGLIDADG family homing endonuclease [Nanoarchaeota archaeon]